LKGSNDLKTTEYLKIFSFLQQKLTTNTLQGVENKIHFDTSYISGSKTILKIKCVTIYECAYFNIKIRD
jgi:hypothetical protein